MARDLRHAFWGYRTRDTLQYLEALEARLASRQETRTADLSQLRLALEQARQEEMRGEQEVHALQAEYFRLTGELTTLAGRSEEILDRTHQDFEAREQALRNELESRRDYHGQLQETIQVVPHKLRAVIEEIASKVENPAPPTSSRPLEPDRPGSARNQSHG